MSRLCSHANFFYCFYLLCPLQKQILFSSYLKNPAIENFKPQNILRSSLEIRSTHCSCIDVFLLCVLRSYNTNRTINISESARGLSILIFSFDFKIIAICYSYVSVTSYMKANTNNKQSSPCIVYVWMNEVEFVDQIT